MAQGERLRHLRRARRRSPAWCTPRSWSRAIPNDGVAYELDAIAAVVIGGTTLSGGTGTVGGTIVGILIIGIINNSMGLNNVDANLQLILKGVIILVAVWLQRRRPAT